MKKLLSVFTALLFFVSCTNPCSELNCAANGDCDPVANRCDCDQGWEGDRCEVETRSKFTGTYAYTQSCNNAGSASGTCIISNGGGSSGAYGITITSLNGYAITGEVTTEGAISFGPLSINQGSVVGNGSGLMTGNTIDINITFSDNITPSNDDVCTFVLTKQ